MARMLRRKYSRDMPKGSRSRIGEGHEPGGNEPTILPMMICCSELAVPLKEISLYLEVNGTGELGP